MIAYVGALARQRQRYVTADAVVAAGAGDDCGFAFESEHGYSISRPSLKAWASDFSVDAPAFKPGSSQHDLTFDREHQPRSITFTPACR